MELASNYAQIKQIVDQSPSLKSAFCEIAKQGLVTVKYDAFARHWKRLVERKEQEARDLEALNAQSCADLPGAVPAEKPKKARPSIGFSLPTDSKGIEEQW